MTIEYLNICSVIPSAVKEIKWKMLFFWGEMVRMIDSYDIIWRQHNSSDEYRVLLVFCQWWHITSYALLQKMYRLETLRCDGIDYATRITMCKMYNVCERSLLTRLIFVLSLSLLLWKYRRINIPLTHVHFWRWTRQYSWFMCL